MTEPPNPSHPPEHHAPHEPPGRGSPNPDPGRVAEWEAGASRLTGGLFGVALLGIASAFIFGLPLFVLTSSIALLVMAIVANRVVDWIDEGGGTLRSAIANRVVDVWDNSMGSFYGAATFFRFVQLEVETAVAQWAAAGSLTDFLRGGVWEILVGFSVQSILNMVQAVVWPIGWITRYGILGIFGIAIAAKGWDLLHDGVDRLLGRHPALPPDPDDASSARPESR